MDDATALRQIESIKQLKARYCRYLDAKDWEAWRNLFADDFIGDTTDAGGRLFVGRDEFVGYTRNTIGRRSQVTVDHPGTTCSLFDRNRHTATITKPTKSPTGSGTSRLPN
jgi:SnoaL-like domain